VCVKVSSRTALLLSKTVYNVDTWSVKADLPTPPEPTMMTLCKELKNNSKLTMN